MLISLFSACIAQLYLPPKGSLKVVRQQLKRKKRKERKSNTRQKGIEAASFTYYVLEVVSTAAGPLTCPRTRPHPALSFSEFLKR
jgi:hypothetical protein